MENIERRVRKGLSLRHAPLSELVGRPFLAKRCDALGCEAMATEHCSSHGAHFCHKHFEAHRESWHCHPWASLAVARC